MLDQMSMLRDIVILTHTYVIKGYEQAERYVP